MSDVLPPYTCHGISTVAVVLVDKAVSLGSNGMGSARAGGRRVVLRSETGLFLHQV